MSDQLDVFKELVSDFRYGITVVGVFILGLLLLFFEDLTPTMQDILIPSLVVYTLGTGVITCIQMLVTASANTKARAKSETPRGVPEGWLSAIVVLHVLWFVLLIGYNVWRGSM